MTKKDQPTKQERLKDAALSAAWQDIIKGELEEAVEMLSDILITLQIEESKNYKPGEVYIARRLASAFIKDVINQIDTAGVLQEKTEEEKDKDSFE